MAKTYVVTGPAAMVYSADRSAGMTVYRGGAVPADADNLQHLLDIGLVEEGTVAGGVDSDPDLAPPFPLPKGAGSQKPAASTSESDAPAGNASLDEWRAYALKQDGVTEESIDGLGRDDLRDQFGPK